MMLGSSVGSWEFFSSQSLPMKIYLKFPEASLGVNHVHGWGEVRAEMVKAKGKEDMTQLEGDQNETSLYFE